MLCSVEEGIKRGGDMKKLVQLMIQYIHDTYPSVEYLSFNDLSTKRCDTANEVNLAVMTYLYAETTWYEKNFRAQIAPQSKAEWERISTKYQHAKKGPWDTMKRTIKNYKSLPYTAEELQHMYESANTWRAFFEPIAEKITIQQFCIFVSEWLDSFIAKYFNNLMGLTYRMPIAETHIQYTKEIYHSGGRYRSFFRGASKNKTLRRKCTTDNEECTL
jgi:hypothetical protein